MEAREAPGGSPVILSGLPSLTSSFLSPSLPEHKGDGGGEEEEEEGWDSYQRGVDACDGGDNSDAIQHIR